jgi:AcrR family transcriptional regulator
LTPAQQRARARRGEGPQLREEILDAAEALLVRTASEDAVSIRAVAEAVGVTPPSIYRHFEDKTHLLFEVCVRSFGRLADEVVAAEVPGDPIATLAAQARAYVRFGTEHPEHYRIMFMGNQELTPAQYAEELLTENSAFGRVVSTVREVLASGRARPEVVEAGELQASLLVWANVHGLTSLLVAKPNLPWPDRDATVEHLIDRCLHGILR